MGDEQDGLAGRGVDARKLALQRFARDRVERGERLVHQQDVGLDRERPRQRHPLALTAGQLMGITAGIAGQSDQRERRLRLLPPLVGAEAAVLEAEADIAHDLAPRQQPRVLEHHRHRKPSVVATRPDGHASGGRRQQARDHAQQGGLADAGRPDDGHEPPGRNVEAEVAQDLGGVAVAAKRQPDLIETDYRFHRSNHDCRATNPVSIMP